MNQTNQPKKSNLRFKSNVIRAIMILIDVALLVSTPLNIKLPIIDKNIVFILVVMIPITIANWYFYYDNKYYNARKEDLRKLYVQHHPGVKPSEMPFYSIKEIDETFKGEAYIEGVEIPDDYPQEFKNALYNVFENGDEDDDYDEEDGWED